MRDLPLSPPRADPFGADDRRSPGAPVVLLAATLRWPVGARLAMALADLGCRVEAVCPRGHPATLISAVAALHPLSPMQPLDSLADAIDTCRPDLVLPCDDGAAVLMHWLNEQSGTGCAAIQHRREVLVRSLGRPSVCELATRRAPMLAQAAQAGVRIAPCQVVPDDGELRAWLFNHRLPAVLKADGTWGGQGVAVVRQHEEARSTWRRMASPTRLGHAVLRSLLDRDMSPLLQVLHHVRPVITVQDHVEGRPANRAVACWQGRVLAGISVEALQTQHPTGPATVVRTIDHAEMAEAAERLVRHLGLSGLWGLDFMIENASGDAYLVEVNPRATPVCHLALGAGADLPAALYAQLTGALPAAAEPPVEGRLVALFPGEWRRDAKSAHLQTPQHDVPWREPALVRDGIALPWAERGLAARAWHLLRGLRPQHAAPSPMTLDKAH